MQVARLLCLPVAGVVLARCAPPADCLRALAAAGATTDPTAPLVAALALLAWACTAYLLLLAALTLGARLPGPAGHALAGVLRRLAPGVLRRALELALGLAVVAGPLAGGSPATADSGGRPPAPAPSAAAPAAPADPAAAAAAVPAATGLDWPGVAGRAPARRASAARGGPAAPTVRHVVVRPGDTLWGLAARQLGRTAPAARVAAAWPQWWQANREVVGPDPDLLHPGTRLVVPRTPAPPAGPPPSPPPHRGADR